MPTPNRMLRHERQLRGWSQAYLAQQMDIPDYYVSRWERGEVVPSPYYQQKLCSIFGKTAEDMGFFLSEKPIHPEVSIKILISYAHADQELCKKLEDHLSVLKYSGEIIGWQDQEIPAGADWLEQTNTHLNEADVILFLVSSSFLASKYCWSKEVLTVLERHKAGKARVIPIILKPVHWQDTPLGQLQALPTGTKPVTQWNNTDAVFEDIAQGILRICSELQQLSLVSSAQAVPRAEQHPRHIYPFYDVFVKSGTPTITFVEPTDFEALKHALAQPGRGVVIEGPSGVGKTTAVEKAIERLASRNRSSQKSPPIQLLSARNPDHRSRLRMLRQWHKDTVIVDDFHRLDAALRQDLVDYLKYLADTNSRSRKLVIVGIPRTGQTLVDASFDISTRIDAFSFGHVPDELIIDMIEKGENALNILFDRKVEIALVANGSLNIAQFLCFNLCQVAQIDETCDQQHIVPCDLNAAQSSVIKDLSRKFGEPIRRFASMGGPRDSTSLLLLEELVNSEDGFLSLSALKSRRPDAVQHLERFLTERWIERLFHECQECQQHFFFDQAIHALTIDDPQLAFYLRRLRFSTLAKEAGKFVSTHRKIFISYSHKDERWLERLRVHLKPIEREGIIDLWDDTKIAAGIQWKEAISEAIETSKVAVLLISADFLASDFISEYELPRLVAQTASGGTVIIPIIVSPCFFYGNALSVFQSINSPKKPLSTLSTSEREQVLVNVAETIIQHLANMGIKQD